MEGKGEVRELGRGILRVRGEGGGAGRGGAGRGGTCPFGWGVP